ncbi:MAG: hypothetical protein R3284_11045, partial [Rubricoccaceae bacterium]|nr:hypothetical protein [Rubricoccaceae bacterium]
YPSPIDSLGTAVLEHVAADFDLDWDVDSDDEVFFDSLSVGAPFQVYDFGVQGTGIGPPYGDPSQIDYRYDDERLYLNGQFQDPQNPSVVWDFTDYGALLGAVQYEELVTPAPITDSSVQAHLLAMGVTAEQITNMMPVAGLDTVTAVVLTGADFSTNTVGTLASNVHGTLSRVQAEQATEFYGEVFTLFFSTGNAKSQFESKRCPYPKVAWGGSPIKNPPRPCALKDCEYVLEARGFWPKSSGGTFTWLVTNGADKTDPDSASGPTFPVTFVAKSAAKNDITIQVVYTDPFGQQAEPRTFKTTCVEVSVTFDPPPDLTTPESCTTPTADQEPFFGNAIDLNSEIFRALAIGGRGQKAIGIINKVSNVSISTDPPCEECCREIRVGFIQNVMSYDLKATYDTPPNLIPKVTPGCPGFPILDTGPGFDHKPFYGENGTQVRLVKTGAGCNEAFDLQIVDTPGAVLPLCLTLNQIDTTFMDTTVVVQKIERLEYKIDFKAWLVAEIPSSFKLSSRINRLGKKVPLHQWDWTLEYDYTFSNVNCATDSTATDPTVTITKACAETTYNGPFKQMDWDNAVTSTDHVFNDCYGNIKRDW